MIPYDFHPEAKAEFIEAMVFYESQRLALGNSFAKPEDQALPFALPRTQSDD